MSNVTPPTRNSTTTPGAIVIGILLIVETCAVGYFGWRQIPSAFDQNQKIVQVPYELPAGYKLQSGPSSFFYDPQKKIILYRGELNEGAQSELVDLFKLDATSAAEAKSDGEAESNGETASEAEAESGAEAESSLDADSGSDGTSASVADPNTKAQRAAYELAIDRLAFEATARMTDNATGLLMLGAIAGLLGVMCRSLTSFILHGCVMNDLNPARWWPWYFMRQPLGMILGGLLIVMVKGGFVVVANSSDSAWWWLGASVLVGFVATEFAARLRDAGNALFGRNNGDNAASNSAANPNPTNPNPTNPNPANPAPANPNPAAQNPSNQDSAEK